MPSVVAAIGLTLFFVLVPISLLPVSLSDVGVATEQCAQGDDTCVAKTKEIFDVFGKWFDDMSKEGAKFLAENVFVQQDVKTTNGAEQVLPNLHEKEEESKGQNNEFFDGLKQAFDSVKILQSDEENTSPVEVILERARLFSTAKKTKRNFGDILDLFLEAVAMAKDSFDRHFGHLEFKSSIPISLWYWIEREDEYKNPSWKRRQHRFHSDVDIETVHELHKMLYLSALSYVNTVEQIQEGLEGFEDDMALIYAQLESFPGEPAHFIALKKEQQKKLLWQEEIPLEVVLVVRGTKEFGDVLSDVIMDATDYRGGKTHDGVARGGVFLAKTHIELMNHLLEVSGRQKIRLTITGHSLGAGAAAIAAIEFNDYPNIDARAIGFGCPALLSKELSESTKDYITTVIADSDVGKELKQCSLFVFLDTEKRSPPIVTFFSSSDEWGSCSECRVGYDVFRLDESRR